MLNIQGWHFCDLNVPKIRIAILWSKPFLRDDLWVIVGALFVHEQIVYGVSDRNICVIVFLVKGAEI